MAGVKITALPPIAAEALTDIFPVVQAGVTSKATVQQLSDLLDTSIQITQAQVTGLLTDLNGKVSITGDTMTGALILSGDPVVALGAATKQYVDSIAEGLHFHQSCVAATTANLAGYVYDNGAAGVGATLTAGANGAFSTDGVSPALNARILVAFQTSQPENGIYVLSQVGDGSNPAILTRALDYDQPSEIDLGDAVLIQDGTLYAGTLWIQTETVVTVGVSNISFTLTNSAANINAGVGLTKTGNTIDLDVPVDPSLGGTGVNNGASTMTVGGDFEMSGAFTFTGTVTANTAVTFPTSGTLATLTDISGQLKQVEIQVFTSNGTYTPTAGMTYCIIECVGPGGGGGGCADTVNIGSGGGGGGGGYSRTIATAADIGVSQAVTVGTGGAAGAAGNNNGSAGSGATSVGALCTANAGGGGSGAADGRGGSAGNGGAAGTGDVAVSGSGGANGQGSSVANQYDLTQGRGAQGPFGGQPTAQPVGIAVGGVTGNGGNGPGAGGNGGGASNSSGTKAGGAGANGIVIITEFVSP